MRYCLRLCDWKMKCKIHVKICLLFLTLQVRLPIGSTYAACWGFSRVDVHRTHLPITFPPTSNHREMVAVAGVPEHPEQGVGVSGAAGTRSGHRQKRQYQQLPDADGGRTIYRLEDLTRNDKSDEQILSKAIKKVV